MIIINSRIQLIIFSILSLSFLHYFHPSFLHFLPPSFFFATTSLLLPSFLPNIWITTNSSQFCPLLQLLLFHLLSPLSPLFFLPHLSPLISPVSSKWDLKVPQGKDENRFTITPDRGTLRSGEFTGSGTNYGKERRREENRSEEKRREGTRGWHVIRWDEMRFLEIT